MRIEIDGVEKGRLGTHTHTISVVFFVIEDIYIYIIYRTSEVYSEDHWGSRTPRFIVGEFCWTEGCASNVQQPHDAIANCLKCFGRQSLMEN